MWFLLTLTVKRQGFFLSVYQELKTKYYMLMNRNKFS